MAISSDASIIPLKSILCPENIKLSPGEKTAILGQICEPHFCPYFGQALFLEIGCKHGKIKKKEADMKSIKKAAIVMLVVMSSCRMHLIQ